MGDRLHAPRDANPKGFFEDYEINGINEVLLAQVVPPPPPLVGKWLFRDRPGQWQRWLARVAVGTPITCPNDIAKRIRKQVQRQPFCYKDPRFSYTLQAWRPFLVDTAYICVFRDPSSTVKSILKECRDAPYLQSLHINAAHALEAWALMYRSILEVHANSGEWLFLHFDQMLEGDGLDKLEAFLGASVDRSFPEVSLRRSVGNQDIPAEARQIYRDLCERASYTARVLSER
jgi:hypothetical protein